MERPSMVNILKQYEALEQQHLERTVGGEKAAKWRKMVKDVAHDKKSNRLLLSALYSLAKYHAESGEKIDRSQFSSTISRTWEIEKDSEDRIWVLVDKEKAPKEKKEQP